VCACVHLLLTEDRVQQSMSVLGVQCTQKSDSLSQLQLPARHVNDILASPHNSDTRGCQRSAVADDWHLRMTDSADNRGSATAAAAGGGDDNSNGMHTGCYSSAVSHQQASLPHPQVTLSSAAVPPATCMPGTRHSGQQKDHCQQPRLTSRPDTSSSSSPPRQSGRPPSQPAQTSSVPANHNLPSSFYTNSAGKYIHTCSHG